MPVAAVEIARQNSPVPSLSAAVEGALIPTRTAAVAGERKQVTVLFCDLAGSTALASALDPEEYRELLDLYLELAIREVDKRDGIVNQLAGDGFMALFGAPVSHEDEPAQSIHAGLAIQAALRTLSQDRTDLGDRELLARIGIHTGPVVVGTVGNDLKMDYTAIGDTTNLAARIQQMAEPGSVWISATTRNLVSGRFELEAIPPRMVKGKEEPLHAFEVRAAAADVSPMSIAAARGLTPLIGLTPELNQLESCFARMGEGLAQLVSLIGDPGTGKSRLVHEFQRLIEHRDVIVLEARAAPASQSVPFAPLTAMLKEYFALAPGEDAACTCEKIAERVRPWDVELDSIYPPMCQLLTTPRDELDVAGQLDRVTEAFGDLIGGMTTQSPVVIILEDLHWLDEASHQVLRQALTELQSWPILVILTHRPEFQTRWDLQCVYTQIHLRPLSEEHAREVVRARAGGALPEMLERRIAERAEGNPFFLEEITRSLIESGEVQIDDTGKVKLKGSIHAIRIPDSVQELIEARLDRLTPDTKRVAQVASVLGRQFRNDRLQELLASESIDVPKGLDELVSLGLLRVASSERGEYRFGESLTQSVCYEALLMRERRTLHERVASLYENDPRGLTAERAGLMAHHLAKSANRERAVASLMDAARDAADLPSYPAAEALYRQAWELAEQRLAESSDDAASEQVLAACLGLCRIGAFGWNTRNDAETASLRAQELADELGNAKAYAEAVGCHGLLVLGAEGDRFQDGVALLERAVVLARETGDARLRASAERILGWAYLTDGRFAEANRVLASVRASLESIGDDEPPSDMYLSVITFQALGAYFQEDLALARKLCVRGFAACEQVGNRTLACSLASYLAQIELLEGRYREAIEWAERGNELAKQVGSTGVLRVGATIALAARRALGEPGGTSELLQAVDQSVATAGDFSLTRHWVAELLIEIGEFERAKRYAETIAFRAGGRLRQLQSLLAQAHVLRGGDDASQDEAEALYAHAIEEARAVNSTSLELAAQLGLASVQHRQGKAGAHQALEEVAIEAERRGLLRFRDQARKRQASDGSAAA